MVYILNKITIQFFGVLKQITGKNEVILDIDKDETINTLIHSLIESWPKLQKTLIDTELGTTGSNVIILINDRETGVLEKGMKTTLENEDTIVIIPIVHGGLI